MFGPFQRPMHMMHRPISPLARPLPGLIRYPVVPPLGAPVCSPLYARPAPLTQRQWLLQQVQRAYRR